MWNQHSKHENMTTTGRRAGVTRVLGFFLVFFWFFFDTYCSFLLSVLLLFARSFSCVLTPRATRETQAMKAFPSDLGQDDMPNE